MDSPCVEKVKALLFCYNLLINIRLFVPPNFSGIGSNAGLLAAFTQILPSIIRITIPTAAMFPGRWLNKRLSAFKADTRPQTLLVEDKRIGIIDQDSGWPYSLSRVDRHPEHCIGVGLGTCLLLQEPNTVRSSPASRSKAPPDPVTVRGVFALAGILKVGETHVEASGQVVKAYFSTFEDLFGESLK
ncbi:hypothetical protein [Pseudomonas sp. BBP2017]|uniref:hypothetical protein n=1 Tax=Pseudomonas sp. BBP2017 TaxID=2109731 RepID=UPI0011B21FEF|nr:hypothetical protein [Pseudomonas sp. BBP2017]